VKILEAGIGRGSEGRRHTGGELGSRVLRLDPVQKFGVQAVAFHRWYQCGSLSIRMRKEDVSDARCQVQPLHYEMIVMTYETVHVLIRLGSSSGRESRSIPRRSMDSLSRYMSGYSCKRDYYDPL